jgi:hypothetical protein
MWLPRRHQWYRPIIVKVWWCLVVVVGILWCGGAVHHGHGVVWECHIGGGSLSWCGGSPLSSSCGMGGGFHVRHVVVVVMDRGCAVLLSRLVILKNKENMRAYNVRSPVCSSEKCDEEGAFPPHPPETGGQ